MSDDDELPGAQRTRTILNMDDVSDDEDYGSFVMLKTGKERREALRQVERERL